MNVMTTAVTNFGDDLVTGNLAVNGVISAGGSVTAGDGLVSLGIPTNPAHVVLDTSGFKKYIIYSTNGANATGANNLEFYNQTDSGTVMKITNTGSVTIPGSFTSNSNGIFAVSGDIQAQAGSISASGTVTGGGGLIATTGGVTATAGNIVASAGTVTGGGGLIATTGGVTATAGNIVASAGTVTGIGLIASSGGVGSTGNIVSTGGNIVASTGTVSGLGLIASSGGVTLSGNVTFLATSTTWSIIPSVNNLTFMNNVSQPSTVYFDTTGKVYGTSFTPTSDYRLKSNIAPLNDSLNIIQALRPVNYTLNVDPSNIESGFIAHELQEVLPGAVKGEKDGPDMQAINPVHIIAHLVGAVQELTKRLEQLSG